MPGATPEQAKCGPVSIIIFLVFCAILVKVAHFEITNNGEGEVVCEKDNTTTVAEGIETMHRMAEFPVKAVDWRRSLWGAAIGSAVGTFLITRLGGIGKNMCWIEMFIILTLCGFLGNRVVAGFHQYHGYPLKHKEVCANMRRRLDASLLANNATGLLY